MSLSQLHYTSAPPGPDGSGFRFTAVSPGVTPALLREAEQLIGYEPPRDLAARPDAEQLKSFPKAFAFSELSDGGMLLSRSVYTGADYSGRWGNFHAHAFHLPPGVRLPDGALPITAWESPRWADATPEGGRTEPVDRFEPSGLLRRDGLVAFARSRADRLAAFFADLRALADGTDTRQIVLVEHDSADVAQWIALACTVLAREQAHRLTFVTYTRRPQQARQQIVGALPSSEPAGHDHRFRVHDCTAGTDTAPVDDAWADVCARVWAAGRPELFRDGSGELGRLAVAALVDGVGLRADGRAAAARWAADHAFTLPEESLTALVAALAGGAGEPRAGTGGPGARETRYNPTGTPLDGEPAALAALLARLDGQVPTVVSAPLAARVLASAVRARGPVPPLGAGSLTPALRAELARDLAPDLRRGVADAAEPAAGRPLALLRVADLLDVDCTEVLAEFAGRIARDLVSGRATAPDAAEGTAQAGPDAGTVPPGRTTSAKDGGPHPAGSARFRADGRGDPARSPADGRGGPVPFPTDGRAGDGSCPAALLDAVHGHPALRTALFGALNSLAAANPPGVAARLAGSGLPVSLDSGFPHLRMCVQAGGTDRRGGDRLGRFHEVLRTAGVSPHAEPAVLRTAFHLVWPDGLPTGEEASLLLDELGSDAHRVAGTRDLLVGAALAAPADDPAVPVLATRLLRGFPTDLPSAHRGPLLLLEFAGQLGTEAEGEGWVNRVLGLRDGAAEAVPEPVTRRVCDAVARRLLAAPAPESELYALARSGDPALLAAYARLARSDRAGDRLRTVPSYVAACFCDWSAYPGTHPAWDEMRTALLSKVLRPVVRALPAEDLAEVEEALRRTGRGRLDAYHAWNRPGALGRLAGRLTGRGRREDRPTAWYGDVEPPDEEGRR
ncbi:GTPase-associated protein 1-related protein [Streptomyces sp. NPDC007971]|uniref:GTPase-associated protein 1-related protein n=1 Tax=Streptomyces sp. NPDC007971 TaxID=3364799 RepID=UPI0036E17A37